MLPSEHYADVLYFSVYSPFSLFWRVDVTKWMRLLLSAGKNIQYKLLSFRVNISRRNEYFSNERMNDVGTYCHTRKQVIIYWPMEYTYSIFIIFSKLLLICFTLSFFDVNFRIVMPKKTNESAKNNLKELAVFFSLLLRVCVFFFVANCILAFEWTCCAHTHMHSTWSQFLWTCV